MISFNKLEIDTCSNRWSPRILLKSITVTPDDFLRFATQPTSVVITGIDSQKVLDQAFQFSADEKNAAAAANGEYELFKTTSHFDITAQHPEWLEPV